MARDLFGQQLHTAPEIRGENYSGFIVNETHAAILFDDGERRSWLPKSKIHVEEKFGNSAKNLDRSAIVTIPNWLAKEKGIIE